MSLTIDHLTTLSGLTNVAHERKMEWKGNHKLLMAGEKRNELLGNYIKSRRLALGLSVVDASSAAGLDHTFWRKLEAGQYESPSPKALAPLARVLRAPLEDVYGLAGYESTDELPTFTPYLRSKYRSMPPEAVAQLESYFGFLRDQYGIPADQPVFPPRSAQPQRPVDPKPPTKPKRPTGGPWDDPTIHRDPRGTA